MNRRIQIVSLGVAVIIFFTALIWAHSNVEEERANSTKCFVDHRKKYIDCTGPNYKVTPEGVLIKI